MSSTSLRDTDDTPKDRAPSEATRKRASKKTVSKDRPTASARAVASESRSASHRAKVRKPKGTTPDNPRPDKPRPDKARSVKHRMVKHDVEPAAEGIDESERHRRAVRAARSRKVRRTAPAGSDSSTAASNAEATRTKAIAGATSTDEAQKSRASVKRRRKQANPQASASTQEESVKPRAKRVPPQKGEAKTQAASDDLAKSDEAAQRKRRRKKRLKGSTTPQLALPAVEDKVRGQIAGKTEQEATASSDKAATTLDDTQQDEATTQEATPQATAVLGVATQDAASNAEPTETGAAPQPKTEAKPDVDAERPDAEPQPDAEHPDAEPQPDAEQPDREAKSDGDSQPEQKPRKKKKRKKKKGAKHLSDKPSDDGKKPSAKHMAKDKDSSQEDAEGDGNDKDASEESTEAAKQITLKDTAMAIVGALKKLIAMICAIPGAIRKRALQVRDFVVKYHRTPQFRACVAALVAYVILSLFFSWRYLPGTTINGRNASLRTPHALIPKEEEVSSYAAQVQGEGVELSLESSGLNMELDAEGFDQEASTYLPSFAWPIQLISSRDFQVTQGIHYDEQALATALGRKVSAANKGATETTSASLRYDDKAEQFTIIEEKQGDMLDFSRTLDEVGRGVATLQSTIVVDEDAYVQPSTRAANPRMQLALRNANTLANQQIRLVVNETVAYTIKSELLRSWIAVDDSYGLTGDVEAITKWAQDELSKQLDTVGTKRRYTRTDDGKTITVEGGTYGWVIDAAKLAKRVCESIAAESTKDIEVPMQTEAVTYVRGGQDWGNRYVDIDLSEQYVRMFDDDSKLIWSSPCVTGNISQGHDTVLGVFSIQEKEPNATLTGLDYDNDGKPDYESKVGYWMPFYGGYGLHDALWRDYFGYDAYVYDGSHGCVNLPYYAAQELYELVEVGDPVIVHW